MPLLHLFSILIIGSMKILQLPKPHLLLSQLLLVDCLVHVYAFVKNNRRQNGPHWTFDRIHEVWSLLIGFIKVQPWYNFISLPMCSLCCWCFFQSGICLISKPQLLQIRIHSDYFSRNLRLLLRCVLILLSQTIQYVILFISFNGAMILQIWAWNGIFVSAFDILCVKVAWWSWMLLFKVRSLPDLNVQLFFILVLLRIV